MWIVVAILKWIGILFGAILGLCLFLAALVIFVPVRYRIWVSRQDKTVYCFKFSWLFSLLSVKKGKCSSRVILSVFGIPIRCLAGENEKKDKKKSAVERKTDEPKKDPETAQSKTRQNLSRSEKPEKRRGEKGKHRKRRKDKRIKKKKNFSFRKVSSIIGFMKQNWKTIRRLLGEVQSLIRYLSPTKVRGEMILGTGDPASTGLVFGGLSLFPVFCQDGVKITPDFEQKRFEAKGYMKGRLRMVYFLRLMFRLYKDRELKRLWKQFNQVKKEAA